MTSGVHHEAPRRRRPALSWAALLLATGVASGACGGDPVISNVNVSEDLCDLDTDLLWASLPPDAIPALTRPDMVAADSEEAAYLFENDRVLGMVVNGEARAYPHNILWWHEIINDEIDGTWVTVTLCPLTGSGLAFDPVVEGRRLNLGVSGLLFANNLVMFDRESGGVFGPQLATAGKCGTFRSVRLGAVPVQEMSWGRWKSFHPDTRVVSENTGFPRSYRQYPYGAYDQLGNDELLFPMPVDRTRPIKERVLVIRTGEETGRGYPFGELGALGTNAAVNEEVEGIPTVVFYEAIEGGNALAFDRRVAGQTLTFTPLPQAGDGYRDQETGSTWRLDGLAVSGPLAGERLTQRVDSYVAFWFAWRHFVPRGETFSS
ncbi:MAG: DUF3179 domain-containing protein [Gemmatimonadota bacterium]